MLNFILLAIPFSFYFGTDESLDCFSICLCTNNEQLIANLEMCLAVRNTYYSVVENARADNVSIQELRNLSQGSSSNVRVLNAQVHIMSLGMRVSRVLIVQLLFLLICINLTDVLDKDGCTDDTNYTERVSAGITVGDTRSAIRENAEQSFVGGTKTRGVGNGTIERTYHHWQVVRIAGVKKEVITSEHHQDVEQDGRSRQHIEGYTTFLKTLEETWTYLQTNHEDEENQSKVLYEGEDFFWTCKADMSSQDTSKEHEGYTQRDAENLDLA